MRCGFSLCLWRVCNFKIRLYAYLWLYSGWRVGGEVLHLHSYTDFRISTNPLNWHTEWCMFVSMYVFLVMAFVIFQKLSIDPHDDLLLALFGLRIQMYIILMYAGLSSLSVLSQWKPVLYEPQVHEFSLEHSGM